MALLWDVILPISSMLKSTDYPEILKFNKKINQGISCCAFLLKFLENISPFCGTSDTPILGHLTSALGFKIRVDSCLNNLSPACNGLLRFTSGTIPADLLEASMVTHPFWSTYLETTHICGSKKFSCVNSKILSQSFYSNTFFEYICYGETKWGLREPRTQVYDHHQSGVLHH